MLVQLKEALGYAAYITCTTFLPNAVNVVTLFYGALSLVEAFAVYVRAMHRTQRLSPCIACGPRTAVHAGGNLVLDERMSAGSLVSFMLYVTSLNGALQVRSSLVFFALHQLQAGVLVYA